jgi:hypothetical protein
MSFRIVPTQNDEEPVLGLSRHNTRNCLGNCSENQVRFLLGVDNGKAILGRQGSVPIVNFAQVIFTPSLDAVGGGSACLTAFGGKQWVDF